MSEGNQVSKGPEPQQPRFANGRRAALEALDVMMGDPDNIQRLYDDMQGAFEDSPLEFFQEIVRPLIPKTMLEGRQSEGTPEEIASQIREFMNETDNVEDETDESDNNNS